ncbi:MAG: hypothetical protein ACRCYP_03705 [Alphaproteobacteria bacterium]
MKKVRKIVNVAIGCAALTGVTVAPPLLTQAAPVQPDPKSKQVVKGGMGTLVHLKDKAKQQFILDEETCPRQGCFCVRSFDRRGDRVEMKCSEIIVPDKGGRS